MRSTITLSQHFRLCILLECSVAYHLSQTVKMRDKGQRCSEKGRVVGEKRVVLPGLLPAWKCMREPEGLSMSGLEPLVGTDLLFQVFDTIC